MHRAYVHMTLPPRGEGQTLTVYKLDRDFHGHQYVVLSTLSLENYYAGMVGIPETAIYSSDTEGRFDEDSVNLGEWKIGDHHALFGMFGYEVFDE